MQYKEHFYVYIMANSNDRATYIGVTTNLAKRIWQHKSDEIKDSHTSKYKINKLVYYEVFDDWENAITREKQLKKWKREWKVKLIDESNPNWEDLYESLS